VALQTSLGGLVAVAAIAALSVNEFPWTRVPLLTTGISLGAPITLAILSLLETRLDRRHVFVRLAFLWLLGVLALAALVTGITGSIWGRE
jgi:hypothetical protein